MKRAHHAVDSGISFEGTTGGAARLACLPAMGPLGLVAELVAGGSAMATGIREALPRACSAAG